MEPRNVIMWILLPVLVVLAMSAGVQAQELREVPASEILEKIQAGEDVFLENVRITGELNLGGIELETVLIAREKFEIDLLGLEKELNIVESKITIINSVFGNATDFSNTQFKKPVDFRGTSFLDISDFRGVSFGGDADFWSVSFDGGANFGYASFEGNSDFGYASFDSGANFGSASFDGYADFGYASFDGYSYFGYASFEGNSNFRDADFGGDTGFEFASFSDDANFENTDFGGYANFEVTSFSGRAYFTYANFSDDADFKSASFSEGVNFWHATFGDDAYFWHVHFCGNTYFDSASFGGDAEFTSAEFDEVDFSNTAFSQMFLLHDADFKRIKVSWSSLKDLHSFDGLTYIKLIKNFREMEQFKDADDAYYQYRRQSQANKEWSFSKLSDIFMWLSCGYGVKPWRTAAWAVAIVLIFTPFYFWRGGIKRLKENNEDEKQDVSLYDAFYFSMTTFTTLGYGDLYPADRYRMAAVVIEGLVGWLILALFLVTLANVMIRP
jgi:hypothetical protein